MGTRKFVVTAKTNQNGWSGEKGTILKAGDSVIVETRNSSGPPTGAEFKLAIEKQTGKRVMSSYHSIDTGCWDIKLI